jgi:hypothetical protein
MPKGGLAELKAMKTSSQVWRSEIEILINSVL